MAVGSYWPDHLLTLDDWDALPEDNSRYYELAEGVLIASPRPPSRHQRTALRLCTQIEPQLPCGYSVLMQSEVVVDHGHPPTVRVPDVLVGPTADIDANLPRWNAGDLLLAVEVLADGTRRTDRRAKFFEYAAAGIRHYWLVDLEPVGLTVYQLNDGDYELAAIGSGAVTSQLAGTPITIDLPALTSSRAGR
ncbi:Uma2 family endonuclease [Nocardia sp. NPDC051900]|uniref:Uma2 family endonuclease n=1 Tax=Nocardia sp. NPDC051900 TaxID=3364326 RepID=UPI003794715A